MFSHILHPARLAFNVSKQVDLCVFNRGNCRGLKQAFVHSTLHLFISSAEGDVQPLCNVKLPLYQPSGACFMLPELKTALVTWASSGLQDLSISLSLGISLDGSLSLWRGYVTMLNSGEVFSEEWGQAEQSGINWFGCESWEVERSLHASQNP